MMRSAVLTLFALATFAGAAPAAERKPNIILIVADDLGYGELGCQGNKEIPTPNIDSIAANGTRMTSGYVSCPVCSPTRAGLITGRYQQRFGHEFNPGPEQTASESFGLPLAESTLPQRLKGAGYATGMVGKWHLGYKPEYHPLRRGFDSFFGFLGGAHPYFLAKGQQPILRGTEAVDEKEYLTDAFRREAIRFVGDHAKEPFFLYLTFNGVHNPLQATESDREAFPQVADPKRKTFAAMLSAVDRGVGGVLEAVREAGIEGETLIFFISDNGGPTRQTTSRNDPLGGFKGQVREGGIRVPFLAQWKGVIPAGKVYDAPVISLDIAPTALAAAGIAIDAGAKFDGVNLLPHLRGEEARAPHDRLYWRFGPQHAIREGDWKLIQVGEADPQLFDLAKDPGESRDLAPENGEVVGRLHKAWSDWDGKNVAPLWKPRRQAAR